MEKMCRAILLFAISLFQLGCGYSFQGEGTILPPDVKKIAIPMVENATTETNLTTLLTEALQDTFEQYGVVSIVDSISDADAVLQVKIIKIKRATSTTTAKTDSSLQQDVVLTIGAELRRVTGPLLWKNASFSVVQGYGTTSGTVLTSSSRFAAGGIRASDIANLDARELSRGQEQEILASMAESVA